MRGIIPEIAASQGDMTQWRRHLHQHPELDLDCHTTSDFVVARLRAFGITDIHRGFAQTGVVAIIEGRGDGPTLGLRADMDALPIHEETGHPWQSTTPGVMHACGHDGHTVMLLGAAQYLSAHRNFRGRVALIFQPGEELSGGGRMMVEEGVFDQFDIAEVYAMHTLPGVAPGTFHTKPGALLASVDDFSFCVKGRSGHVAYPDQCLNPIERFGAILSGVAKVRREVQDLFGNGVIEVTVAAAGTVTNIVPGEATLSGSVRSLSERFRTEAETRLRKLADADQEGFSTAFTYTRYYPVLVNAAPETAFCCSIATDIVGASSVDGATEPHLVAEDFSYMLQARPGGFVFLGQGGGPGLHNSGFDFNDDIAPIGASYWAHLVETRNPLSNE